MSSAWVPDRCACCGHALDSGEMVYVTGGGLEARLDLVLAALVAAEARVKALADALAAIRDMEPKPVDDLPEHDADCPECRRRTEAGWPPSGMCEQRYSEVARRGDRIEQNRNAQHYRMRTAARAALVAYREAGG